MMIKMMMTKKRVQDEEQKTEWDEDGFLTFLPIKHHDETSEKSVVSDAL